MPIGWSFFSCTRSSDVRDPLLVDRPCGDDVSRTTNLHLKPTLTVPYDHHSCGTTTISSLPSLPSIRSTAAPFRLLLSRGRSKMSFRVARQQDLTALSFFSNRSHIAPSSLNVSCRSASSRPTKPSWFCSSTPCVTGDADQGTGGDLDATAHHRTVYAKTSNVTNLNGLSSFETRDECHVPPSVLALFVYLAQQGVHVSDLFRRPGNISQMKQILECFTAGQPIDWSSYNVYTVANVAKKLLLAIPGGLFGLFGEEQLLATASSSCSSELDDIMASLPPPQQPPSVAAASISIPVSLDAFNRTSSLFPSEHRTVSFSDDAGIDVSPHHHPSWSRDSIHQLHLLGVAQKRISVFLRVLSTLPPAHQEVAVIMFGILHQLVFHSASTGAKSTLSSMRDLHHSGTAAEAEILEPQSNGCRRDSNPDIPLLTVAEGVVKSVAGTLFHTCCTSVQKVEQTAQVLRSLVLYFPSMGESVIRFYIDAVADRLTTTTSPGDGGGYVGSTKGSNQPVCILCPESGHANYFDSGSPVECERRPCPTNLFHAASRLFCLNGSYSTPIGRKAGQRKHLTHPAPLLSKLPSSSAKPRFVCPPFGCKIHASPTTTTVSASERTQVNALSDAVTVPSIRVTQCPKTEHEEQMAHGRLSVIAPSKPLQTSDVDGNMNASNVALDHNIPTCTITLRRNQSRYRSLRRRQMENLSRRAEWFLGPTTLPIVTLHHPPDKVDLVVTSTMSLLDLDDSVVRKSNHMTQGRVPSLLPPRLLFTASTGELGEPEFDSASKCDTAITGRSEPGRHRFPSVGSYLDPMHADSYISLHSAPSCGLHRFDDKDSVPLLYPVRYHPPELKSTLPYQHPSRKEVASTNDQRCQPQSPVDMTTLTDCPNLSGPAQTPLPVGDEAVQRCSVPLPGQTNQNALCSLLYRPYADHRQSPLPLLRAAEDFEPDGRPRRNSALPALQSLTRPTEDETLPHGRGQDDM
ncbi:unnamed protein product [Dicrocoelium dendriticum]|nr:unnamed protein product [Dicrocoelium dendriticum]